MFGIVSRKKRLTDSICTVLYIQFTARALQSCAVQHIRCSHCSVTLLYIAYHTAPFLNLRSKFANSQMPLPRSSTIATKDKLQPPSKPFVFKTLRASNQGSLPHPLSSAIIPAYFEPEPRLGPPPLL